jgi:hypothetical protein
VASAGPSRSATVIFYVWQFSKGSIATRPPCSATVIFFIWQARSVFPVLSATEENNLNYTTLESVDRVKR